MSKVERIIESKLAEAVGTARLRQLAAKITKEDIQDLIKDIWGDVDKKGQKAVEDLVAEYAEKYNIS